MASAGPSTSTTKHANGTSRTGLSTHEAEIKISNDGVLMLQVRAFLDASEEVDIDVETVEDLMQIISGRQLESESQSFAGPADSARETDQDQNQDEQDEDDGDSDSEDFDISALYGNEAQAQQEWTKQEIKQMMHHLKERGMSSWIKEYVHTRNIAIPKLLRAFGISLCSELQEKRLTTLMYFLRVAMSRELRLREKLTQYNTIFDVVHLIRNSRRILILTGAGISVSCGIPDFRSRDGLYASLKDRGEYELDDPQQMFDINYFRENPAVFYSFASQIYPANFIPSPCHRFIKLIEDKKQLLRNYSQNIDTLEIKAGITNVLQCHGSFATASCILCHRHVPGTEIEDDILRQKVPRCTVCNVSTTRKKAKQSRKKAKGGWDSDVEDESDGPDYPPGIMKPDITFFGEKLTDEFDRCLASDRENVDLLLVIGTSLKVSPVAETLSHLPHSVPQILINKTPIRHINPDVVLLGNADEVVEYLCAQLEWELPPIPTPQPTLNRLHPQRENIKKRSSSTLLDSRSPERVGDSHVWLFHGAEGGKWLKDFQKQEGNQISQRDGCEDNSRSTSLSKVPAKDTGQREPKKARVQYGNGG